MHVTVTDKQNATIRLWLQKAAANETFDYLLSMNLETRSVEGSLEKAYDPHILSKKKDTNPCQKAVAEVIVGGIITIVTEVLKDRFH